MPPIAPPDILLIMEDGEEAHAVHVLGKYHFANTLKTIRRRDQAKHYFLQLNSVLDKGEGRLPEMIIVALPGTDLGDVLESSRRGALAQVPVVAVADTREEEERIRARNFPNTYVIGKPLGFFKLLEAMQKLGMYWIALRSPASFP
jgi:DNA-binding response OmpR family regulator